MKRNCIATAASLVVSAVLMGVAAGVAAPAQADTGTEVFLRALADRGLIGIDPATAITVGESICPQLVEPGQTAANVAADVAEAIGPATMFTGVAISIFCPGAVAALLNGQSPIPPVLLGL